MPENSFLGTEMQPDYIPTSDEKTMAVLSHILTLVAPILAPLIIYLVKKNESRFVEWHAKESLNFQITIAIIIIIHFIYRHPVCLDSRYHFTGIGDRCNSKSE